MTTARSTMVSRTTLRAFLLGTIVLGLARRTQAQTVCAQVFEPVCCNVRVSASVVTKSNSCSCSSVGGTVIYQGECVVHPSASPSPTPMPADVDVIMPSLEPMPSVQTEKASDFFVCNDQYDPVCCDAGAGPETKTNECFCNGLFGTILYRGDCIVRPSALPTNNPMPCVETDPVCCRSPFTRAVYTAIHKCECESSSHVILYQGKCTF